MTNHGDATSRTAVVYWSDTGNTEAMADAIAEGIRAAGGEADAVFADSFGPSDISRYDSFAFGCPAMGDEVLEEDVFEPMFSSVEGALRGKRIVLFGSYDWGDGQWMREWEERATGCGAVVAGTAIARLGDIDRDALMRLSADLVGRTGGRRVQSSMPRRGVGAPYPSIPCGPVAGPFSFHYPLKKHEKTRNRHRNVSFFI